MSLSSSQRKSYVVLFICLLALLLLAACGSNTSASSTPTSQSTTGTVATQTASNLLHEMTLIGTPTAKIISGTTFEVDGKVKNGDDKQHDIYVQVTLLDASGKSIATATQNVDNVAGGATVSFAIRGTTSQPTWQHVQAKVVKVTENENGSGSD